ncbi:MAG TPA: aldo/keto reductase [Candidatus Nitrosopolaris sp.]|nr:aldo/keto reductase [Candidatus Nitrosopolaris sp.]
MRYVQLNGVRVSAIGLGTWQFGSWEWGYGAGYASGEAAAIVARALELGVNLIDTAEAYGLGRSERILGAALGRRRADAFLATKIFPILPLAPVVEQRARASAGRLGVEAIDLYQVHWPNPVVPIATTMEGMRRAQQSGLVRHAGVSNFSLPQWQAAEEALGGPVLANQVEYNLVARRAERHLLPHAARAGRLIIAYSPLAQGFLSARYDAGHPPPGLVRRWNALFLPDNLTAGAELLRALRDIAASHRATPAQVALAWVIRRPNVVAIPGASSVAQLEANAAAADLDLSDAEDRQLSAASAAFQPRRGLAAVPGLISSAWMR